jgi:hypothetical protein
MLPRLTRFAPLALVAALSACEAPDPALEELPNMGDFRLGYNIVVADNMQQVPPSRSATAEEWVSLLTAEIDRRFGEYDGDRLYHIGIAIDGYSLAPPGVPLVVSPRSILVLSVNVWDDAAGAKLHDEPEQIVVFEGATAESSVVGSGLSRTREEQMQGLVRNAAQQVQRWMLQNPEWFSIDPDAPPFRAAPADADVAVEGDVVVDEDAVPAVDVPETAGLPEPLVTPPAE